MRCTQSLRVCLRVLRAARTDPSPATQAVNETTRPFPRTSLYDTHDFTPTMQQTTPTPAIYGQIQPDDTPLGAVTAGLGQLLSCLSGAAPRSFGGLHGANRAGRARAVLVSVHLPGSSREGVPDAGQWSGYAGRL
jgi:hypothetical protein